MTHPRARAQLWDVINIRDSTNIAFTDLDLGLHMDLLCVPLPIIESSH